MNKKEQQKYQAQDDAYTMARYHEIMQDKGRAARAVKVANEQAKGMQMQAKAMQAVAKTKISSTSRKKK
jgi:hypothetical protein